MAALLILAWVLSDKQVLDYHTDLAPQGLRMTKVTMELGSGNRARLTLEGRYTGFDNGKVWFDLTLKNTGKTIGTKRGFFDLIRNQTFSKVLRVQLLAEPNRTRAYLKFGELIVK